MSLLIDTSFLWNETVWNPSMISTALWLDAADATTVTTVSGAVSQWNDKSGNGRNATQSTTSERPVYVENALYAKSVVGFDGSDDFLLSPLSKQSFTQNQLTIAMIYVPTDTRNAKGVYQLASSLSSSGPFVMLQQQNASIHRYYVDGNYRASYAVSTNEPLLTSIQYNGAQWEAYTNGLLSGSFIGGFGTYAGSNFYLGNGFNGFASCQIAEVVVLPVSAATLTRQKLEGYLAHKWGLGANLPNDHPYKTVGPKP